MATVAYQETDNNFERTGQKIKGNQIVSIKVFPSDKPSGVGEFIGQLGLAIHSDGKISAYIADAVQVWQPFNMSIDTGLPDYVVREDTTNDFKQYGQTILNNQIMSASFGTTDPVVGSIHGDGQMYVNTTNMQGYISSGGTWLKLTSDALGNVAVLDKANNFTNTNQTIGGHNIATLLQSSQDPLVSKLPADRDGELYVQLAEGTPDRRARLFISQNTGKPELPQWEEIKSSLPTGLAYTNKGNNFQTTDQQISGKQILSFVDGGDKDPGESKLPADYDGQFYVAVKTNPQGVKDAALWVAHGNQWLPALTVPEVDTSNFAKLTDSNNFQNIYQTLGAAGQNRRVMTCRVKIGGHAPNADASWEAYVNGEETLYVNGDEISLWKAMWERDILNPPSHSYWRQIWPSVDTKNVAFLNAENIFKNRQFMDGPHGKKNFTVASRGAETPYNLITPYNIGDMYIQDISIDGRTGIKLWVATDNGQPQGWKTVYDSLFEEDRSAKLDLMDKGITDNAEAIAHNDKDIADLLIKFDGHQKDIEDINKELDAVDVRFDSDVRALSHIDGAVSVKHGELVFVDRTPYFALQRGHADWARVLTSYHLSGRSFDALSEEHDTLSATVDTHAESITGHDTRISAAHTHAQDAHDAIGNHETRIAALEADTGETGGLSAQDLAETPHVIKGSKVSEGYLVIDRTISGVELVSSEVQKYSHFKLLNTAAFYLRLPPISNSPTDSPSYPEGKILTFEKGVAAQTIISVNQAGGATIQDMNGDPVDWIEVPSNTEIKVVTMIIDGEPVYRVISERSTDLEATLESQSLIITTLTGKISELEDRLNKLQIWKLDWSASDA